MSEPEELHDLEPRAFYERVHSFEFWFESVRGYLEGTSFGHAPDAEESVASDAERDRLITVLCNYCVGETAALEGAAGLIEIAPDRGAKVFLSTQVVDEGRHLEVLVHRLQELGVGDPEVEIQRRASPSILLFRQRLLQLVHGANWTAAIFAQNVVLESMEFSVFQRHAQSADPRTREVLQGIIKDERRHIGFGENELGRCLKRKPEARGRLRDLRQELDSLVLRCFTDTLETIGAPRADHAELSRHYLEAVRRLGFA
jgi:1,2-phenylacetyl-CoA epoxidase catalytic subunit